MTTDCRNCPLRKLDAFESLEGEPLAFLERFKAGELQVEAGTTLLMEGSNSPQLYTPLSGMGLRYKLLPDGGRQVVNFVLPGDFVGLQAGVMGQMQHSVEATTPMLLCVFNRADLWSLFKQQPTLAFDLTWLAAQEEHFLGEALSSVGQLPAVARISWALLRFFRRCEGLGLTREQLCPFPYRQQDLADALGLSLVHTNKTLMKLKRRQVAYWTGGELRIQDMGKLEELATLVPEVARTRPVI